MLRNTKLKQVKNTQKHPEVETEMDWMRNKEREIC